MKTRPLLFACWVLAAGAPSAFAQNLPILFVTQVPPPGVTGTVTSIGGNHLPTVDAAPRGGDLMIRYSNYTVRNLTYEAGFGNAGTEQGVGSIAVRDPRVHWSGQKAVFSMVVSSANPSADRWQLYEVSGLGEGLGVNITRLEKQPVNFNNVQPCYAPDDRIIFVSDRTRDGSLTTYPALDEKGTGRINTGLWSLDPQTGDLMHLEHSPSGSFNPVVDSYGRVLFTRWDHLQRDEKVIDAVSGGFDYPSETSSVPGTAGAFMDTYPDPLGPAGTELGLHFDLFMPWTVNPDGTDLLTLNHVGRHELSPAFTRSRTDANLTDFFPPVNNSIRIRAASLMQLTEHPTQPGRYFGVDAVLNGTSTGRVVSLAGGASGANPVSIVLTTTNGNGFARDPVVLANGTLLASVANGPSTSQSSYGGGGSPGTNIDPNQTFPAGNPLLIRPSSPSSLAPAVTAVFLPSFITLPDRSVVNYGSMGTLSFTGKLWQLQPAEVRPMTRPAVKTSLLESAETEIFYQTGVSPNALRAWLRQNGLALLTVRNVTTRDSADRQQPTNLAVPGGISTVTTAGGPLYEVKSLQFLQGEYLRGYGLTFPGDTTPDAGRRIKAVAMREMPGVSQTAPGAPEGSVSVATDGSAAAIVPARRALSWQLVQPDGAPVVRERYWLSFQAGEVRSCTSCHGVNMTDQAGHSVAVNPPAALRSLLENLKQSQPSLNETNSFRIWSEATHGVALEADGDDDGDGISNMVEWAQGTNPLVRPAQPALPMKLEFIPSGSDTLPRVSFSRSLTETRVQMFLEGSSNLEDWRTVARFGNSPAIGQHYVMSGTPQAGGRTELVTLTSLIPANQSEDRFYRLRVSTD